jgi:PPP family 3-phenylpropionic acid transporter
VGFGCLHRRTLICGVAVDHLGPPAVLYVGWVGVFCLTPLALLLPGSGRARGARSHAPFHVRDLLSSPPFVLFLIAAGLCQASHAVLYSFGTLTWRAAGIDDVTISLLWGESVAVEILMMMASGWLMQRIGVTGMVGLGLACAIVRWTGMAFTTELPALVILQALHAGTFAACHLGAMAFIQRALPSSGAALGQSIYYALGTGTAQAVIYQFAGVLYSQYGQRAFLGMSAISVAGLLALIALARLWKGELLVGASAASPGRI